MEVHRDAPIPAIRRKARAKTTEVPNRISTSTFVYSLLKKFTVISAIYCAGYMNWSIAWLITPILLADTRTYLTDTNIVRRKIAKASANGKERDTILACIKDLPSWVIDVLVYSKEFYD